MAKKFQWTKDHFKAGAIVADQFSGGSTGYLGSTLAQSDLDFSGKKTTTSTGTKVGKGLKKHLKKIESDKKYGINKNRSLVKVETKIESGKNYNLPAATKYNSPGV